MIEKNLLNQDFYFVMVAKSNLFYIGIYYIGRSILKDENFRDRDLHTTYNFYENLKIRSLTQKKRKSYSSRFLTISSRIE